MLADIQNIDSVTARQVVCDAFTTAVSFFSPATSSNSIGGVELSSGYIVGDGTYVSNVIASGGLGGTYGGVLLSGGSVVTSGTISGVFSNASTTSNRIGGVVLSNGYLIGDGSFLSNISGGGGGGGGDGIYGGVVLNSGNVFTSGTISGSFSNANTTTNTIGGVRLNSNTITLCNTTPTAVATFTGRGTCNAGELTLYRNNGLNPGVVLRGEFGAGGGGGIRIQNSNGGIKIELMGSNGSIVGYDSTASNSIGGVILSNTSVITSGTISGLFSNASSTSNNIGGVRLSNTTVTGSQIIASNTGGGTAVAALYDATLGGIVRNINTAGTTTVESYANLGGGGALYIRDSNGVDSIYMNNGSITTLSNKAQNLGGVVLSNTNVNTSGTISGVFSNARSTLNQIGGAQFQNGTGYMTNASSIGTVALVGNGVSNAGDIGLYTPAGNPGFFASAANGTGGGLVTVHNTAGTAQIFLNGGNGNISNVSTSSNSIGGVTLTSNLIATSAGSIVGACNSIGGVQLGGSTVVASNIVLEGPVLISGGVFSNGSSTSNTIGGVVLSNGTVTSTSVISGVFSNASSTSNSIGGVTLTSGRMSNGGTTSNTVGGVILSNSTVIASQLIACNTLGNAVVQSLYDATYGGTIRTINNSAITTVEAYANIGGGGAIYLRDSAGNDTARIAGGAFINQTNTSNSIGGIVLSNTSVITSGTISGVFSNASNTSNNVGGVQLSNTSIMTSGTISGVFSNASNTSNSIGGVQLSNTTVFTSGTISGVFSNASNTSNNVGGVQLSNTSIMTSGTISGVFSNASSTSNNIGGFTFSNGSVFAGGSSVSLLRYLTLGYFVNNVTGSNGGAPDGANTTAAPIVYDFKNTPDLVASGLVDGLVLFPRTATLVYEAVTNNTTTYSNTSYNSNQMFSVTAGLRSNGVSAYSAYPI